MSHIGKFGSGLSLPSQSGRRWLSPEAQLYVDHAVHLVRQGKYVELLRGGMRMAGRAGSRHAIGWQHRLERWARSAVTVQPLIDSKHNRLTPDGFVVEKMSITFPSATAPMLASIVVPCFNYGRFIREAVDSALGQTVRSLEVIVVDDGSTEPDTHEVLATLEHLPRVRVVRQDNAGLPSARNTGIALARGEYICCLDADDTLEPTYVEMAIAVMEADRSVGFAYSWVQLFGDASSVWQTRDFDIEEALIDNHTSVAAVFRRDDWIAAGGYRPDMRQGYEDWEFWLRLSALGHQGRVLRTPLFNHRRHGRTMTHDAHDKRQDIMRSMRANNPRIFDSSRLRRKIRRLHAVKHSPNPLAALHAPGVLSAADPRPHLLVIAPRLADGGAEILLLDILTELRQDWRMTVVTTMPDQQIWWPRFREITTDIVPLFGAFADDVWPYVLDHLIATHGTRVVLSHGSTFAYAHVASLKQRHPQLATVDILHNDLPSGHIRGAVLASESIDAHVAISETVARSLATYGVPSDRISIIPNGVDTDGLFHPDNYDRQEARRALGLAADGPVLAWVGRLSEEKRPLQFVDVVASLAERLPVAGVIVGDGALASSVETAIDRITSTRTEIRRIAHLQREHMPQVYAAADFVVMTSTIEGLPFVALEALACGCPVAATDVGGLKTIVRHGETGFLVPADKPGALAEHLASALHDRALVGRMRTQARNAITASHLTQAKMLKAYRELISRVLVLPDSEQRDDVRNL